MIRVRAFKFRLYPSKKQEGVLLGHLEACRILYNDQLEYHKRVYEREERRVSQFELNNRLPELKEEIPKLKQVHSQVLQNISKRIKDAFTGVFSRLRKGLRAGLPRFKSKNRYKSITYPQSGFKLEDKLWVSKIGELSIRKHRELRGSVKTLTIKKTPTNKWFAIFISEVEFEPGKSSSKRVGVDVGVKHLAVLSDGKIIDNPSCLRESESKLQKLQKRLSRKEKGSNNWKKARLRVARMHEKIHNQRMDYFHKVSRILTGEYGTIVVEDLNIKNMLKNHKLAKSISDSSWNKLLQLISYKAEEAGGGLIVIEARGTTQQCSQCGRRVPKKLEDRVHDCPYCGLRIDRDLNAAKNILNRGTPGTGGTDACGDHVRPLRVAGLKNQEAHHFSGA